MHRHSGGHVRRIYAGSLMNSRTTPIVFTQDNGIDVWINPAYFARVLRWGVLSESVYSIGHEFIPRGTYSREVPGWFDTTELHSAQFPFKLFSLQTAINSPVTINDMENFWDYSNIVKLTSDSGDRYIRIIY